MVNKKHAHTVQVVKRNDLNPPWIGLALRQKLVTPNHQFIAIHCVSEEHQERLLADLQLAGFVLIE